MGFPFIKKKPQHDWILASKTTTHSYQPQKVWGRKILNKNKK